MLGVVGEGGMKPLSVAGPPRHLTCDRCGWEGERVQIRQDCSICGPTPLCLVCYRRHAEETDGFNDLL